jgi:hypothetical protein
MLAGSRQRNGIRVAQVTEQDAVDVPGFYALPRNITGIDFTNLTFCTVLAQGIEWVARNLKGKGAVLLGSTRRPTARMLCVIVCNQGAIFAAKH